MKLIFSPDQFLTLLASTWNTRQQPQSWSGRSGINVNMWISAWKRFIFKNVKPMFWIWKWMRSQQQVCVCSFRRQDLNMRQRLGRTHSLICISSTKAGLKLFKQGNIKEFIRGSRMQNSLLLQQHHTHSESQHFTIFTDILVLFHSKCKTVCHLGQTAGRVSTVLLTFP